MAESDKMNCPDCGAEMNHHADKLVYAGRVGTGYSEKTARDLYSKLAARRVELDGALIALLPLLDVEVLIDDLHPERAADQRSEDERGGRDRDGPVVRQYGGMGRFPSKSG